MAAVWVPAPDGGFLAATVVSRSGDAIIVQTSDGKKAGLAPHDVQPQCPPEQASVDDISRLTTLNEPSVLHVLATRYAKDTIYTYCGLFCVAVNPYKQLPIYEPALIAAHHGRARPDLPPHLFSLGEEAYRNMLSSLSGTSPGRGPAVSQAILCTGESGAGKTENTKYLIRYFVQVAAVPSGSREVATRRRTSRIQLSLEDMLLRANPVLESFGNAATIKNANSSRFGKFISVHFSAEGFIVGASLETYLLEKARVVRQGASERSFHAFHQLLRGADATTREQLLLPKDNKFAYLPNADMRLSGVDDADGYSDTNGTLGILGFAPEDIANVWRVLAAVLHLGQLAFVARGSEQAELQAEEPVQRAAYLLGVDVTELSRSFLRPKVRAGSDYVTKQQNVSQALLSVESIAKATYERMFLWLVRRINGTLARRIQESAAVIGILDIAGFEILSVNSFEQLCINLTNECLQQRFNNTMFIMEQQEYAREQIEWTAVDYGLDLQPCIDLLETGVLNTLEDQCMFAIGTDSSFVEVLKKGLKGNAKFVDKDAKTPLDSLRFSIVHYAGTVPYDARDWIVKNKDPFNDNVAALLGTSTCPLVAEIWSDFSLSANMSKGGSLRTVGRFFKDQLHALMDILARARLHFLRCILPNGNRRPGLFVPAMVLEQLRCNGVLEGVRIFRKGFPGRLLFSEFLTRYSVLRSAQLSHTNARRDPRAAAVALLSDLAIDQASYRVGLTKVFFQADILGLLDQQRDAKLGELLSGLQARCRGYLTRKQYPLHSTKSAAREVLQRNARVFLRLRAWPWWKLYSSLLRITKATRKTDRQLAIEREVEASQERLAAARKALEEAETAQRELGEDKVELLAAIQHESDLLTESEHQRGPHLTRKAELEASLADSDERRAALGRRLLEVQAEALELRRQGDELEGDVKASTTNEERYQRLNAQLNVLDVQKENLTQEVTALEAESTQLKEACRALQADVEKAAHDRLVADKNRKSLQSQVDDIVASGSRERSAALKTETRRRQQTERLVALQAAQADAERVGADALRAISAIQDHIRWLSVELDTARTRNAAADKERAAAAARIDATLARGGELQSQISTVRTEVKQLQARASELQDDVDTLHEERLRADGALQGLRTDVLQKEALDAAAVGTKLAHWQHMVARLETELEEESHGRALVADKRSQLESEKNTLQDRIVEETGLLARNAARIAELRDFLAKNAAVAVRPPRDLSARERELMDLRQRMAQMELNVNRVTFERRRAERDLDECRDSNDLLQGEVESLRARLQHLREGQR